MDDMTIELHLLVFLHLYMATIAAQVIAGQVDQHDMLCILLGIGAQTLGIPLVLLLITCAGYCACNRVNVCLVTINAAVCLG